MKTLLTILAILVFLGSVGWYLSEGGWEPGIGILASLGTLLGLNYESVVSPKKVILKQKGGKKSKNIQVGGDINITKYQKNV